VTIDQVGQFALTESGGGEVPVGEGEGLKLMAGHRELSVVKLLQGERGNATAQNFLTWIEALAIKHIIKFPPQSCRGVSGGMNRNNLLVQSAQGPKIIHAVGVVCMIVGD